MSNPDAPEPQKIRAKLEALVAVSKDLEGNAKMLKTAANIVAAEQLKKRVDELTTTQNHMMQDLVSYHWDKERKQEFDGYLKKIQEFPAQIKSCKELEVLKSLERRLEDASTAMVHSFQLIVADLMGLKAPEEPVFE